MSIYRINEGFIIKEIKGDAVILNAKTGDYFGLNGVGNDFVQLIDGNTSLEVIIDKMLEMYSVDRAIIENDINELVEAMISKGILVG